MDKCKVWPSHCICDECMQFWTKTSLYVLHPAHRTDPIKGPASISALSTSDRVIDNQNRAALAGQAAGFPYK